MDVGFPERSQSFISKIARGCFTRSQDKELLPASRTLDQICGK